MRNSARNQIKAIVKQVKKGATTANVLVDIGGHIITSSVTNEAKDALGMMHGDSVYVVIKASGENVSALAVGADIYACGSGF